MIYRLASDKRKKKNVKGVIYSKIKTYLLKQHSNLNFIKKELFWFKNFIFKNLKCPYDKKLN